MLAIIAGIITLLIWLWLLLGQGGFWRVRSFLALPRSSDLTAKIAVIIPARDEAEVVGRCIRSLLHQTYRGPLHIILVDDGSSDGTAQIAHQAAEQSDRTSALTVIQGQPLPAGWSGKLWAVQQGIQGARELDPQFLLLTDADIEHAPESISTLAAIAESGGYDLASYMVKLHCGTFAERLLIPAFVFFFFKIYPPRWIANPRRKTAGAAGGCILIRPQALKRAGGIEAVRSEIIDDCALAKAVKQSGGGVWLGVTELARSIRPYGSFSGIGQMISRSAFSQLHHSAFMLPAAMAGLIATYLLPPVLLFAGHPLPVTLGAAAWLLMLIAYMPTVRFYRLNPLWTLFLPAVAVFYMGATLHSAVKYWLGQGGEWKGRVQDPVGSGDRQIG